MNSFASDNVEKKYGVSWQQLPYRVSLATDPEATVTVFLVQQSAAMRQPAYDVATEYRIHSSLTKPQVPCAYVGARYDIRALEQPSQI